jgi:hypothetical protein
MSLSNPRQVNPASKFIEWSGSKGKFYYYDKAAQENVFFEDKIYIVPLDELSTIKGFHKQSESSIYSNEVKNITKEKLIVKSFKGGAIASGLYSEIKGSLEGGKFGKSIYAAMISTDGKDLELVNFQLHGSSLGSFIDAKINVDNGNVIVLAPSTEELKNGNTIYFAPKIIKKEVRPDIMDRCKDMDKELQTYLDGYINTPQEEKEQITEAQTENIPPTNDDDNDLPF